MSPMQHSGGRDEASFECFGVVCMPCFGDKSKFLDEDDRYDIDDELLFHEPFDCIVGNEPAPFTCCVLNCDSLAVVGCNVGVMLSLFLGVERSWTLDHGATCSSGVDGGVMRGFLRGDARTRRSTTPLLLP